MQENKYILRYLPKYEEDLNGIVDYIMIKLQNPYNAMKLVEKIKTAILERLSYPLSFEPFPSSRKRKLPDYRIYVDNFTIYYVVIDNIMEVRRVLYNGRDAVNIIK